MGGFHSGSIGEKQCAVECMICGLRAVLTMDVVKGAKWWVGGKFGDGVDIMGIYSGTRGAGGAVVAPGSWLHTGGSNIAVDTWGKYVVAAQLDGWWGMKLGTRSGLAS